MATGFGVFLALAPWATVPAALVFAAVVATFRYVSLGSVMAVVCLPIGVLALGYLARSWRQPSRRPSSSSTGTGKTSRRCEAYSRFDR